MNNHGDTVSTSDAQRTLFATCIPNMIVERPSVSLTRFGAGLKLAATPVFGAMGLLTAVFGNELAAICATPAGTIVPLGMGTMYALMSVFHVGPWLELLETRHNKEEKNET